MHKFPHTRKHAPRVGIYAGTFDPVHAGHVAFALQTIREAKLDQVVFLPERSPRHKPGVEHFAHRTAMLKQAIKPYSNMAVLELVDKRFTVQRTLPQLQALFPNATLVLLIGSDTALTLPDWPNAAQLLNNMELAVGVRAKHDINEVRLVVNAWPRQPQHLHIVPSFSPHISSTDVREALGRSTHAEGLLASVHRYATANWLYVRLEKLTKS